ncbi:MAG: M24 family metallopeptidase [Puniceicoccaceae bacterium]
MTLFYGSPATDADLYYLGGFRAPDPFLAFETGGVSRAVLPPLEIGRARRESRFDEILSDEEVKSGAGAEADLAGRILWLAARYGATGLRMAADFPARAAFALREKGDLPLEFGDRPLCPGRIRKSSGERESIRRVNRVVSGAFREVERLLGEAEIRDGVLFLDAEPLSSERVRARIARHCLENGCLAAGTIVAGGGQACDPHEQGSGPLPANSLLIVDIFPCDEATGYFGDMTRTYLKGSASLDQRTLVSTVRSAQSLALERIADGVDGRDVHEAVVKRFADAGYRTGSDGGRYRGFFHGTGHGLGLEIHEEPRVSKGSCVLGADMVVTVEPGLYYPGLGGCRIEDVVRVVPGGIEMLSDHPLDWEIR